MWCGVGVGVVRRFGLVGFAGEGGESQTFRVYFGRPGMMNRIGFGNLIPFQKRRKTAQKKKKKQERQKKDKFWKQLSFFFEEQTSTTKQKVFFKKKTMKRCENCCVFFDLERAAVRAQNMIRSQHASTDYRDSNLVVNLRSHSDCL